MSVQIQWLSKSKCKGAVLSLKIILVCMSVCLLLVDDKSCKLIQGVFKWNGEEKLNVKWPCIKSKNFINLSVCLSVVTRWQTL